MSLIEEVGAIRSGTRGAVQVDNMDSMDGVDAHNKIESLKDTVHPVHPVHSVHSVHSPRSNIEYKYRYIDANHVRLYIFTVLSVTSEA